MLNCQFKTGFENEIDYFVFKTRFFVKKRLSL